MDRSVLEAVARQTAYGVVQQWPKWRVPDRLMDLTTGTPTARYLREHPDAIQGIQRWIQTAVAPDQGLEGQRALARILAPEPGPVPGTWWQRFSTMASGLETELSLSCSTLWFCRLDQMPWASEHLARLTHLGASSPLCLFVAAYELLGAVTYPDSPALVQAFAFLAPPLGSPQSIAGRWPSKESEFYLARVGQEEAEESNIDAATAPIMAAAPDQLAYLLAAWVPRKSWLLPLELSKARRHGIFILPGHVAVAPGPN